MSRKLLPVVFIAFYSCLNGSNAQDQNNSLKLIASVPLHGVRGRIDHLSFDSRHQILFVAALGNNTVEVVDLKNKKVINTIKDLSEPQGIVFIPESNSIFVANGGNGECDIFDAGNYQKLQSVKLSDDADNVRYDSAEKKIYVGYGNGGIAIIDAITFQLIAEIKFPGHPESFQLDKASKKIYVNVPDEREIDIIDLENNRAADKWKMNEAASNFPMSFDAADN
ncbi:MAG TPA: YncE family protein, partial [Chitinophagaceae bacterium]|nr:YncE family protein [Chitinophagaceae bacterium]